MSRAKITDEKLLGKCPVNLVNMVKPWPAEDDDRTKADLEENGYTDLYAQIDTWFVQIGHYQRKNVSKVTAKPPSRLLREDFYFKFGDIVICADGELGRVYDVQMDMKYWEKYARFVPIVRVQRRTKKGEWSKVLHKLWPGQMQRGYAAAGDYNACKQIDGLG